MAFTYINTTAVTPRSFARFRIETPLPDAIADDAAFTLANPSDNAAPNAHMFIPTGVNIDNFYVGYYLDMPTTTGLDVTKLITAYDGVTRIATTSGQFGASYDPTSGNELVIRKENGSASGVISLSTPAGLPNSETRATLGGVNTSVPSASVGAFIKITSLTGVVAPILTNVFIRRILTSTNLLAGSFVLTVVTFSPTGYPSYGSTDTWEILPFSYDNFLPLSFSGNIATLSAVTCYEIKLINLLLPNTRNILNGRGGKFSSYPFVWVEFSGGNLGITNAVWSNSRGSSALLFKVPMKDVNHPDSAQFIKLDGAGMSQFIPFTPVDKFKFSIRLPDGTVPEIAADTVSPVQPNELIQISATFEIRKRT
jgi:hypothetical protein